MYNVSDWINNINLMKSYFMNTFEKKIVINYSY